ncbi:hypothetical protein Tco_0126574 [Tanacetum coccineum]
MAAQRFAETHNIVEFLEKPKESDGFAQIVDFLNAHPINYTLTVNLTIYTSCIEQFWDTAKAKTVNGEVQLQALVDGKKVIITETSVRRALKLKDAEGIECLPNADTFEQLALMGYEKPSQKLTFYKALFSPQWKFLIHTILQCLSAKTTAWNEFSSTMASTIICLATNKKFNFSKYIFESMLKKRVKVLAMPTDPQHTPTITQPSTSQPQKKQPRRKQRKDTEVPQPSGFTEPITNEAANEEHVPIHSNDSLLSSEDRLKLNELMELCTNLSQRVLDLEKTKTSQAAEITELKERVKKLEKKGWSRTHKLKRLYMVGRSARVVSSKDEGLGDQEDASKQWRKIADIDDDVEVTLIDETRGRNDEDLMFDTGVLDEHEVEVEKRSKPKAVITAATTTTTAVARPKARGVIVQEPSEFTTTSPSQPSQLPQAKDKGKAKMKKRSLQNKKEEDENIAEWDNVQAMIDADYELATRLQPQEQEELTIEEKSKMFVELMDKRKKHFKDFDKTTGWIDSFVSMDSEVVNGGKDKAEGSETIAQESSSKRAGTELEHEVAKKQKINDDQEEAEMKKHMEIVVDEEKITVDAIPLATKPLIIIDWKIIKEGKIGCF